jgi:hypothetical protein
MTSGKPLADGLKRIAGTGMIRGAGYFQVHGNIAAGFPDNTIFTRD